MTPFPTTGRAGNAGRLIVLMVGTLALASCAAGSAPSHHAMTGGLVSQFILGLWHGVIAPVTLLVEVLNALIPGLIPWTVRLYEGGPTHVPYDVGFYLGLTGSPLIAWTRWSGRRG